MTSLILINYFIAIFVGKNLLGGLIWSGISIFTHMKRASLVQCAKRVSGKYIEILNIL